MSVEEVTKAARDVLAERERQKSSEGWSHEHDDAHRRGEIASAAACYATHAAVGAQLVQVHGFSPAEIAALSESAGVPPTWPWSPRWWKPRDRRRNLVRAGALILAEIERLDRAEADTRLREGAPQCL